MDGKLLTISASLQFVHEGLVFDTSLTLEFNDTTDILSEVTLKNKIKDLSIQAWERTLEEAKNWKKQDV